jgi:hypothetical protein
MQIRPAIMRHFRILATLILLSLVILPQPIHAQDPPVELPNTYITHDGSFSFQFPEDWFLTVEGEQGEVIFVSDFDFEEFIDPETQLVMISIAPPGGLLTVFPFIEAIPETPRELLDLIIAGLDDVTSNVSMEIEEVAINDHPAVVVNAEEDGSQEQVIIVDLGDGEMALLSATYYNIDYADQEETVMAMAASMTLHDYEQGDFRLVTSIDKNLAFEMPADFIYDDTEESEVHFGSNQNAIDASQPAEGEMVGVITSLEYLETELGVTVESAEDVINYFYDSFTDGAVDGFSFGDVEQLTFEDSPLEAIFQFTYADDTFDSVVIAFQLPDGRLMAAIFATHSGEYADFEETITHIVTSVQPFNSAPTDVEDDTDA